VAAGIGVVRPWRGASTRVGRVWSVECEDMVGRIVGLTRLVGPLPWEKVTFRLLLDGIYERIHAAMGTPTPLTDDDRRQVRELAEQR
jgi:hypothetical protein